MLTVESFLKAARDEEKGQYIILAQLQKVQQQFNQTRLFPALAQLIELYRDLQSIIRNAEQIRKGLVRPIKAIDIERQQIIYEALAVDPNVWDVVERTIHWALPRIDGIIQEGVAIGEFVEEQLNVDIVGVLPSYLQEGYVLIPDQQRREYALVRYEISLFTAPDEKYRALKTRVVTRLAMPVVEQPPARLKEQVQQYEQDLTNPALYRFSSDVDFPFEETLYPIAKRKFLRYITPLLH